MTTTAPVQTDDFRVVSREKIQGNAARWRRFGKPVPAGQSFHEDGSPDYGVFGPGSVVWKVLLHPAITVFQWPAQGLHQGLYKPIVAGVRDRDPMTRSARKGVMTYFDLFERGQRNSGMHAPMWLGDTATAQRMAKHLHNIHRKVVGDVIDVGAPELGGYDASAPRDAMWAALTEMHSMLRAYETVAFRDGRPPHRLSDAERDQYFAEVAEYCRLVGADEAETPTSAAELAALYARDDALFGRNESLLTNPETGKNFGAEMMENLKANWHTSQRPAFIHAGVLDHLYQMLVRGGAPTQLLRNQGLSPRDIRRAPLITRALLPLIWLLQQKPIERHYMKLMWGPDGVELIESARRLERDVRSGRRPAR